MRVEGDALGALAGASLDSLTLLVAEADGMKPAPFQVDERGPDGNWLMTTGVHAREDVDGRRIDANDQLAFMLADARGRADSLPSWVKRAVEIAIADPMTGDRRWAYLVEGVRAPRSDRQYVFLDAETDSIETPRYALTFSRSIPISWAFLALKDHRGRPGPNLIDRWKIRVHATVLVGLFDLLYTEEDIRAVPVGYRSGPVRVIRRVECSFPQLLGVDELTFEFDHEYYRNSADLPVQFELPIELGLLLSDLVLESYVDLRGPPGWSFLTPRNLQPMAVDGRMNEIERGLDRAAPDWLMAFRGTDAFGVRLFLDERLERIEKTLYYLDDEGAIDPPEALPGQVPGVGLDLRGFESLPAGSYWVSTEFRLMEGYERGDEHSYFRAEDAPIRVDVRPAPRR